MTPTETELTEFPCPICNSTEHRVLYPDTLGSQLPEFGYDFSPRHSDHYRVVRCRHCRHAYCSPRSVDLHRSYVDVEDREYLKNEAQRVATARKVLEVIRRFKSAGRLLDVGCAPGDFLDVAKQYYEAEGLELSQWSARIAMQSGHIIHTCRLSELQPPVSYAIITMWGVIEHFEFPAVEITEIHRLLKDKGIVCLWTGNIDSLPSRLLGAKWWYIQGQHIQFFSRESLDKLFQDHGFTRLYLGRYPYIMSLPSVAKSLARYPFLGVIAQGLFGRQKFENLRITFRLPGELFAIFQKRC